MITLLSRILGPEYARPLHRAIVLMAVASVAEGLAYALLIPLLRALLAGDTPGAWPWLGAFAGASVVAVLLRFRSDVAGFATGAALSRGLHHRLGDHLARLPLGWFTRRRLGEVGMLASRGVLSTMAVPAHRLQPMISAVLTPATVALVLFLVDWRLALAALLAAPLILLAQVWTNRTTASLDRERSISADEAASRVVEYVRAQPVLRMGGTTGRGFGLLDSALVEQQRTGRRAAIRAIPGVLALSLTVQAGLTALLVLGADLALGGRIATVDMLVALILATRCVDPLLSLSDLAGQMRNSREELERIDAVLSTPTLPEPAEPVAVPAGDLELDDVTFRRDGREVLHGVSAVVQKGSRVAFVGPSGAGKSTILQLIARFHDPYSGSVKLGGIDLKMLASEQLAQNVSMVFQDVYLFDGTISDNVRMGRPDATSEELSAAARSAHLTEVIDRLPQGWETRVGEGGAALSGGERQRVSIARALLKDAPVLLLDEPTAALDPASEVAVQSALDGLMVGRTVVMVAHRLRTVRHVDRIYFVEEGNIVESGTHHELLARGGRYAKFWSMAHMTRP
ncbi:ABC transporter ATP-binding protein [Actinoplanes oblitus]|uniref:ABC transporter ATP-binding protein n=1 Tax=Actinoplanes oblitus TaxID=3040509 RepID=A0ABY8WSZ6_9ACTN|nr:ABC transporter ATP-binding protein [Actinoplanes oblitus]WIN00583.1 ABC transporter ATP-binding protein [Actinoplanes oblitus]